jgi:hypothetical protein
MRRNAMSKSASSIPTGNLELYERLVATTASVERKGATMPYTSVNGHMFSFLTKEGKLALRLPTGDREAFLKKYKTKLCEQHGTVLKEYVEVPDALLKKTAELKPYFDQSYAYVASLKPKAMTTKRPAAKAAVKRKPTKNKPAKRQSR